MPQYVLKPIILIQERTLVPKDFFKKGDGNGYFIFYTETTRTSLAELLEKCETDIVIIPPLLTMSKVIEGGRNGWIQTDCVIEVDCTEQQMKDYVQKKKIPANKILAIHQKTKHEIKVHRRNEILNNEFLKLALPKINGLKPTELVTVLAPELESLEYLQLKDLFSLFKALQSDNNQLFNKPVLENIRQLYNSLESSAWDALIRIFQQTVNKKLGSLSSNIPKFGSQPTPSESPAPS